MSKYNNIRCSPDEKVINPFCIFKNRVVLLCHLRGVSNSLISNEPMPYCIATKKGLDNLRKKYGPLMSGYCHGEIFQDVDLK